MRADHHVAWRGDELPADCGELLDIVTGNHAWSSAPAATPAAV